MNSYIKNQAVAAQRKFASNQRTGIESVSGVGSSLARTRAIREFLPLFIKEYGINTLADVACGDRNWIRQVEIGDVEYVGFEVVPQLVEDGRRKGAAVRLFNAIEQVPPTTDAILCRDLLPHLRQEAVLRVLQNFRESGSRYLLATTYPGLQNKCLPRVARAGRWGWRPVNLEAHPYCLGEPILILREEGAEAEVSLGPVENAKCLALWNLKELNRRAFAPTVPLRRNELLDYFPERGVCAEVGVSAGRFSQTMFRRLAPTELHLIDPWRHQESGEYSADAANAPQEVQEARYREVARCFAQHIDRGRVKLHRNYSREALPRFPDDYFDLIYVDADHSYDGCLRDLELAAPKLRASGILAGHDYCERSRTVDFGVMQAVDEFLRRRTDFAIVCITDESYPSFVLARHDQAECLLRRLSRMVTLNH